MPRPVRLVLDAGAVLQAAINPDGPGGYALDLIESPDCDVFVSNRLRAEYEKTLFHPNVRAKIPRLTDKVALAILERIDERTIPVFRPPEQVHYARDPGDEHVLNLAIWCGADFIVTRDKDILALADHPDWRQWFPAIRPVAPSELRAELSRWQALPPPPEE